MLFRPFTLFCAVLAGVSGMVLYTQKHKTTLLDHQITQIVYDTQKIKGRTAMLRTEWTLLNQPDRLENLAHRFLPDLHPLAPSQFIQLASLTQLLPPIQKEEQPDHTRQNIGKTVAQDHGQPYQPEIKPDKTDKIEKPAQQQEATPSSSENPDMALPVKTEKQELPPAENRPNQNQEPENKPPVNNRKKTPAVPKKPVIKTVTKPVPKEDEEEKELNSILNSNTGNDAVPPLKQKQVKKTPKPNKHPAFSISDSTDSSISVPKEKSKERNDTPSHKTRSQNAESFSVAKPKHSTSSQTPHYTVKKKHHDSESAFGNDSDDALPPPVPFSH